MANYRYGEYDGGPDPLAAPYDVRGALDDMGDDILGGGTPAEALRDLLRRGWQNRRGLDDLLRRAIADTFRTRLGGADLTGLLAKFNDGGTIESGELVSASDLLYRTGEVPGLARIMARLGMEGRESFGEAAAAIEFALEGLYLLRRLSKDTGDGTAVYRT